VGHTPEALTPLQWVERYFAAKKKSPEHIAQLLKISEALLEQ
jgi:hypothetical protein